MTAPGDPESQTRPELVLVPVIRRYGDPEADADFYKCLRVVCGARAATTFQRDMARSLRPVRS